MAPQARLSQGTCRFKLQQLLMPARLHCLFGLRRRRGLLSAAFAIALLAATTASGQAANDPPAPFTTPARQRLSVNPVTGLVTSPATNYQPLTGKERWKVYWKQNYFSIGAYFGPVLTALVLDQTTNSPPQWGGGMAGFGLRVAARTAGGTIQGTVQAPLAAVLHEDVRYISSPQHGFKRRALHAIEYSFLTYNERGHPTVNVANLGAYYASTAISTA